MNPPKRAKLQRVHAPRHYFPEWLATAAEVAAECAARWRLALGTPFPSQVGYVVPAELRNGSRAVLKINPPNEREVEHEAAALRHYDGRGAVRLLEHDRATNALLVERCDPGTALWELPEEEANPLAAEVVRRLWRPAPAGHPFRTLADEAQHWSRSLEPHTAEPLVRLALVLLRDLAPTQGEQGVLHQDLNQGNILAARREPWLAIDPKPLVGEREFDVASLIRDRRFAFDARLVRRRLDFYVAELGLDRERTRGWTIAHAVAWGIGSAEHIASAEALA